MSTAEPKNAAVPRENADLPRTKVRRVQAGKLPYMVVVGDEGMAAGVVLPRTRAGALEGQLAEGRTTRKFRLSVGIPMRPPALQ